MWRKACRFGHTLGVAFVTSLFLTPGMAIGATVNVVCESPDLPAKFFEFEFEVDSSGIITSMRLAQDSSESPPGPYIERRKEALYPERHTIAMNYYLRKGGKLLYVISIHRHTLVFTLTVPEPDQTKTGMKYRAYRGICFSDATRKF